MEVGSQRLEQEVSEMKSGQLVQVNVDGQSVSIKNYNTNTLESADQGKS